MEVLADRITGMEIAKGDVPQHGCINKFGQALDIDIVDGYVDIWDGADSALGTGKIAQYTYSTTADIDSISSSDDNDTEPVTISGLDTNWVVVEQTKTLQGQTRVALDTPLIRTYRAKNSGSTDLLGDVYVYVNGAITAGVPNTTGDVRAIMKRGKGQTLMAIYPIPAGVTGYLDYVDAYVTQQKDQLSNAELSFRPFGGVFQIKRPVPIGAGIGRPFRFPEVATAKTDIVIRANSSKDGGSVAAGFDLALVW